MGFTFKKQDRLPDHPEGWPADPSSVIRLKDEAPPGTESRKNTWDGSPMEAYPLPTERRRYPGDVATEMPKPPDYGMSAVAAAPKSPKVEIKADKVEIKKGK